MEECSLGIVGARECGPVGVLLEGDAARTEQHFRLLRGSGFQLVPGVGTWLLWLLCSSLLWNQPHLFVWQGIPWSITYGLGNSSGLLYSDDVWLDHIDGATPQPPSNALRAQHQIFASATQWSREFDLPCVLPNADRVPRGLQTPISPEPSTVSWDWRSSRLRVMALPQSSTACTTAAR